jgi:oligopeptidase A
MAHDNFENPLIDMKGLPPFDRIRPEHVEPAVDFVLAENRRRVADLLAAAQGFSWNTLVQPMEDMEERLHRTWSPVNHLNAVVNTDALRAAYNACLPKLSNYETELGQNEELFKAYEAIAASDPYRALSTSQKKVIQNALRDFRLTGIDLNAENKARFKHIMQELSSLMAKFEENVLDATHGWHKHITTPESLAGLPDSTLSAARKAAQARGLPGWVLTLEEPSYVAVMTHADDRQLRHEVYEAYVTRASDSGPNAGQWDNTPVMERLLALRHEAAQLLGFANYAERSLATKMAVDSDQVMGFLLDLAGQSLPVAQREFLDLQDYARRRHGVDGLHAWDIAYYSEKYRQEKFSISQEELRPYFPETRVLSGMFAIVERLYGIKISEKKDIKTWHRDVRFYEIYDKDDDLCGQFYLDPYARQGKRGGAWMDECLIRKRTAQGIQIPTAYLVCNFSSPMDEKPALLTHMEVQTLFHEFGHGLHHMLTKVDYPSVAGINGVEWDAVELPSQFMENWAWEQEALPLFSGHYETGEPLPEEKFRNLFATKNFQSGMRMVRQLEFALFDFRLHREYDPHRGGRIYETLEEVRDQVAVVKPPAFNRFAHSFSHIFAGGYGAGYYSYKWAEVLSSDAFSLFEENGIFDPTTGHRFLTTVLEQGGSREAMELFVEFRGREPRIDALLRHSGISP